MSIYAVLQPRGTQDAGVWSLLEQVEPGEFRIIARGAKDDLVRLSGKLNEHDGRGQRVVASPVPPLPAITVQEVESWTPAERLQARERIQASTTGPLTTYRDKDGRLYTTRAAQLITGAAFIKQPPFGSRRLSDSPQA